MATIKNKRRDQSKNEGKKTRRDMKNEEKKMKPTASNKELIKEA